MKIKNSISRTSIGAYVAFAFSAMAILLTLVLAEIIGVLSVREVKANIGEGLSELAFQTSDKLDRGMFERYREVQLMAQRPALRQGPEGAPEKRKMIDALQDTYPYYAWIGVTDNDGKVISATKGILEGANVGKRPWFQNAYKGVYLGDVHDAVLLAKLLPPLDNEPRRFVDVAFPYADADGTVKGVLGIHLSWQWAREVERSVIHALGERRQVQTFIVAADGTVLLGPPDMLGKRLALESFRLAQTKRYGSVLESWPDGQQYLVGFSKSNGYASYPGLGWTVLVRQKLNDAYQPALAIQRTVLWSGIAIAILFTVLGLLAARWIARPILALARSAQQIGAGSADQIGPINGAYLEVGILSKAINNLIHNLRRNEIALQDLNAELEARVAARTEELSQALQSVQESQSRTQGILETAQDAYIGMDMQGRITDWNRQAELLLGWRYAEIIGQPLAQTLIPARYHEKYAASMQRVGATGDASFLRERTERLVLTRRGDEIPVEITIGMVQSAQGYFFGAFLHDISHRREVDRLKNELVSTVSHELRTPLTAIRGAIDLLVGGAAGTFTPAAARLLDVASNSCRRLVRLINDMLDLEQIDAGRMEFNYQTQDLLPLVNQAIEATGAFGDQFNVRFALESDGQPGLVRADGDRIIQVIVNLLSNAAKFAPAGSVAQVRLLHTEDGLRFSVKDSGEGIPEAFHHRIFEKFGIVDASNTRKKGGTGLGLAICKRIIEEHGGQIGFISAAGAGAEFYFVLPVQDATSPAAAGAAT